MKSEARAKFHEALLKCTIVYLIILAMFLLVLTNCSSKPVNLAREDRHYKGTCVRISGKGREIIEPCWR